MEIFDTIIIGGGPSGITAALYSARKKLKTALIVKQYGGQLLSSSSVENYLGFKQIKGDSLSDVFVEHIEDYEDDISLIEDTIVDTITKKDDLFYIKSDEGDFVSKTVIITTGRTPRKLNVKGEDTFAGKGIAFCATCDAPQFEGKDVLVVGGGNSALDSVLQLTSYANKIYVADFADEYIADPIMIAKAKETGKVEFFSKTAVSEVKGDDYISSIDALVDGKPHTFDVEGLFIEIGSVPTTHFIDIDFEKNRMGEIVIDKACRTSVDGLFAAGDVTDVYGKQVIIAAGEGAKAGLAVFEYLSTT